MVGMGGLLLECVCRPRRVCFTICGHPMSGKSSLAQVFAREMMGKQRTTTIANGRSTQVISASTEYDMVVVPEDRRVYRSLAIADIAVITVPACGLFAESLVRPTARGGPGGKGNIDDSRGACFFFLLKLAQSGRMHLMMAHLIGVTKYIICVTRLDLHDPPWSEARFQSVCGDMVQMMSRLGFNAKHDIVFIPVGSLDGQHVTARGSPAMEWWQGAELTVRLGDTTKHVRVHTFLEALEAFDVPSLPRSGALMVPVYGAWPKPGGRTLVVGRIRQGVVKQGMEIATGPFKGIVESIEMFRRPVTEASSGSSVGLMLRNEDGGSFHAITTTGSLILNSIIPGDAPIPARVQEGEEFVAQLAVAPTFPGDIVASQWTATVWCALGMKCCIIDRARPQNILFS